MKWAMLVNKYDRAGLMGVAAAVVMLALAKALGA